MKVDIRHTAVYRLRIVVIAALALCAFSDAAAQKRNDKLLNRPYADQKKLHLGFSVGAHLQDLKFTNNGLPSADGQYWYSEVPAYSPGFCVNVLADLRLHKHFNLRFSPGMYFGNKTVEMRESTSGLTMRQDIKSSYVVLPLDLKISGNRYLNSRPYVTLGGMATFDIGKRRSEPIWLNTGDFYLTLGLGCDFYLPFFKLCPEVKFCFGLSDVLRHNRPDLTDDPETFKITQSLSKVKSNMIVFNFYFE